MKHVIVTGGTKGIGKAIVQELLKESYIVHTCARSGVEQLKAELNAENLHTFPLDVSDREAIKQFTETWNQPLYGIVNNAGICKTGTEVWDEILKTNLEGPFFLTQGLLPYLQHNGRIINISSQLGIEGRAGYGAYCASKFALIGLTKTWAYELGPKGITVNAICPGWVQTVMAETDLQRMAAEKGMDSSQLYQQICSQLELKRFQKPEEVAHFTSYLLSEKASAITGQALRLAVVWNETER